MHNHFNEKASALATNRYPVLWHRTILSLIHNVTSYKVVFMGEKQSQQQPMRRSLRNDCLCLVNKGKVASDVFSCLNNCITVNETTCK